MKEEILSTESSKKRLSPSLSVPDFRKTNNNDFIDNTIKLNFDYGNYNTIKIDNKNDNNLFFHNHNSKKNYIIKNRNNNNDNNNNVNSYYNNNNSKFVNSEYKDYIYEEGDDNEKLILKNKNLKRLFEQSNFQLLTCLKKQQDMEKKYEMEKKAIIEKLTKIQKNYEKYANSHQKLNFFEDKIDEISCTYNQLLKEYLKINENFKEYKNNLNKLYKNINDFIENNYDKDMVNILSFEYLLYLRNKIKDDFKINNSFTKSKKNNIIQNVKYNEILNNKNKTANYYTYRFYNSDFSKNKNNFKNIFDTNTNIILIKKNKKKEFINKDDGIKSKNNNSKKKEK